MKKITLYALLCCVVALSGCEDYLAQPVDQRTQLNTVEKVSELLATAYPQADYITFTESMSDLALDKGLDEVLVDERNQNPYLFQDVPTRQQGTPYYYWNAAYAAIAAANHALEAIQEAPNPNEYSAQRGEALVARAYAHFMLVTLFSKVYDPATAASDPGIPYVTTPERVVMGQYERKTVAYVYEQIERDLTEGLPLIRNSVYRSPKYHFNTAAAHAFATRFYLFKKDYLQVISHANQVFPGSTIAANLRPWLSVYKGLSFLEGTAIYTQATQNANLLLVEAQSLWARTYYRYRYSLAYPVANELFFSNNVTGGTWAYTVLSAGGNNLFVPKFREHFVREDINAEIGLPYTIIPLFTAEEVLFNRAEAYLELGNTEAAREDLETFASTRIEDYNARTHGITNTKLRNFYGTSSVKQGLMAALLDFKAAEFVHEGMRWFDILRHGITVVHPTISGQVVESAPGDPRRVLQIPQEAELAGIELNPR